MKTLVIRPEAPGDADVLRELLESAFPTPAEAALVDRLRASGGSSIALVATRGGSLLGHVLFSPVTLEAQCAADGGVGLAPVAVRPDCQGQGIGGWLITEGIGVCRRRGIRFVVVLGAPAYYARFGFEPASRYGLGNEYGAGAEFMVLPLRAGHLPVTGGVVRYGPAFAGL